MPRVSISGTKKSFEVNEGEILYDSLLDRGHQLPHGCLAGSCGACRIEVLEGEENLFPAGIIEQNTVEAIKSEYLSKNGSDSLNGKTIRLSCRAQVKGHVVINPFK
jgi:ferredoxin